MYKYQPTGDEIGVTAIHFMEAKNCLAVLFDNGTLRIRKLSAENDIHRRRPAQFIIDQNLLEFLPAPEVLGETNHGYVVKNARIESVHSQPSSGVIAIAYQIENIGSMRSVWRYDKYQVDYNSSDPSKITMLGSRIIEETLSQSVTVSDIVKVESTPLSDKHFTAN